jgi:hypothetical protein
MSMIMLFGVAAVALGVIWASNRQWIVRRTPKPVDVLEVIADVEGGGTEDGILGESLYAPGPEAPDVSTAADPEDVIADSAAVQEQLTAVLESIGAAIDVSEQLMMGTDIGSAWWQPEGQG